jgi:signal transduction histidine kinase/CheY-like chemotaxis protein
MGILTNGSEPGGGATRMRPGVWIAVSSILTLALFSLLAYHVDVTLRTGRELTRAYLEGEGLKDLIHQRHRELSLTAVMLVATRNQEWLERHHEFERTLVASLDAAIESPRPGYDVEALWEIREATHGLSRVEAEAFQMASRGETDDALQLLSGTEYNLWEQRFSSSADRFIDRFLGFLDAELEGHRLHELRSLGISMIIVVICVLMWLYLARRLSRWGTKLRSEVAARERLEGELMAAQKLEAVGRLASGVAHDFGNLLTAIRGYATLAREGLPAEHPARASLARVEDAADQADAATRGLLTFARRGAIEKKPVDLVRILCEGVAWLRRVLPGSIRLSIDFDADSEVWVFGDRGQLQQALLNLVLNARDALPDGGDLRISLEVAESDNDVGYVVMRVADTGQGMKESVKERALEPFFTTKEAGYGTGLGLAMVHGIVSSHAGTIQIESESGQGTCVSLRFPTIEPPAQDDSLIEDEAEKLEGSGLVLLAEGQPYVRDILSTALEEAGFRVQSTASCPDFREIYAACDEEPVLVVMDNDVPEGCGVTCVHTARTNGYGGPIIVITHELSAELESGLDADVMILRKPIRVGDLRRLAIAVTRSGGDEEAAA